MIDDFVFRLGKRAKRTVFSLTSVLTLAEVLFEEFSIEERARFWKYFRSGERPVIPQGTDSEVEQAVEQLCNDSDYRDHVTNRLSDFDRLRKLHHISKEAGEWHRKKKWK